MRTTSVFIAAFLPKPPVRVDYDRFDTNTEKAFSTLVKTSKTVRSGDADCHDLLSTHWLRAWPWFRSFAHAVLHHEQPKTSSGFNSLIKFVDSASTIIVHPTIPFPSEIGMLARSSMLKSTPEVVALTFELWLYATQMNLSSSLTLLTAIGLLFDGDVGHQMSHKRALTGRALSQLEKVLGKGRWDIPGTVVQELILVLSAASGAEVDCLTLHNLVRIPNALIRLTNILPLPSWNAKDAIRWISVLLRKLLSFPRDSFDYRERPEVITECAVECMSYIEYCATADAYFLIPVLHSGILLSFMKARDLLVKDAKAVNPDPTRTLTFHFSMICKLLLFRILHRPISVRLTRWVRKICNANLDEMNDIPFTVAPLSDFRDAWTALKNEVLRRSSVEERTGSGLVSQFCDSAKVM
ncbi:hypothetical protein PQX77_011871 [Marasmius sp. AFHP31]|nr:hypothetical protein PQX77_011871 [Marasmius sp. AFHP31]